MRRGWVIHRRWPQANRRLHKVSRTRPRLQPTLTFQQALLATRRAWAQLPRGTQLAVRGGTIRLHLRTPLASLWAPLLVMLEEGEEHGLPEVGSVEMEALHTAQVVAVVGERVSAWQWLVGRLGR